MNPKAAHFGAEEVDLRNVQFTAELLACVPPHIARRYRVLPVSVSPQTLRIAVADPADLATIDALNHLLSRELDLCVSEASQIDEFIEGLYGQAGKG
jgi:hypothetical protein